MRSFSAVAKAIRSACRRASSKISAKSDDFWNDVARFAWKGMDAERATMVGNYTKFQTEEEALLRSPLSGFAASFSNRACSGVVT